MYICVHSCSVADKNTDLKVKNIAEPILSDDSADIYKGEISREGYETRAVFSSFSGKEYT